MIKELKELFNWKKFPANVFMFAVPLAVAGFGLHGLYAYLMWKEHGQIGYMLIVLTGLAVLAFCLWPVRKRLAQLL